MLADRCALSLALPLHIGHSERVPNSFRRISIGALLVVSALVVCACGEGKAATSTRGKLFLDPQGTYEIRISPDWQETTRGVVKEAEAWTIGAPSEGFQASVNVLTQPAPGNDLAVYLDTTIRNIGTYTVVRQIQIVGVNGNALGLFEFKGVPPGSPSDRPLHFLATVDVRSGHAVVATLATTEASFDELRSTVEPYLRSLQAT